MHIVSHLCADLLAPDLKIVSLDGEHSHWLGLIVVSLETLLDMHHEGLGLLMIFGLVEYTPLLDHRLIEHLVLRQRKS